jgi:hypothetical protein
MTYVLLLTVITSFNGVATQHVQGFNSYQGCAEHAAGWGMSQQDLQPDSQIIWECQENE